MTKPLLIGLMNAYSQGKSGGDEIFIEILKRLKNYNKIIITSLLGKNLCQRSGLKAKFLITTKEKKFAHVVFTYLKRIIKALFLKIKLKDKDLILSSSDILPDVLPAFFLKRKNKKAVWLQKIFHLIPYSRILSHLGQRLSFFFIRQYADAIIADNQILKKELVNLGFNKERVYLNYPGIDLKYLSSIKPFKGKHYEGIFIGQIRPSKGLLDLVDIWKLVCQKKPEAKLGIIGKGNIKTREKLKLEIKKQNLEKNIDLLGYLPDKITFSFIKSSRIFLSPSYEEGFGIAPLQAQACGLPTIAWDLSVYQEVFPQGMIIVKTKDIKKFAGKIMKLLTEKKLYQKLSKEAIKNASQYDWEKVVKGELQIVKNLN